MHSGQQLAAHDFLEEQAQLLVEEHDVVAVPAQSAADMQEHFILEEHNGRELVVYGLGGMEVSHVQAEQLRVADGVCQVELMRADHVVFAAQAEKLAFQGVQAKLRADFLCENLLQCLLQSQPGAYSVHGMVFCPVGYPMVDDAGLSLLTAHFGGDFTAGLGMSDPEAAHLAVTMRQGVSLLGHGMREECGIEVQGHILLF